MAITALEVFGISEQLPSAQPDVPDTNAGDMISRQAAIDAFRKEYGGIKNANMDGDFLADEIEFVLSKLPPARPEQPPYVAEIEAEYQKAVKMPHIHKPLAKALYEVWKKHDRGDAERRTDDSISD